MAKTQPQNDINWMSTPWAVSESTVTEATSTPRWINLRTLTTRENDLQPSLQRHKHEIKMQNFNDQFEYHKTNMC